VTKAHRIADGLTKELKHEGDPERAEKEKRYLKSDLEHLGVSVPKIRKAAKAIHKRESLSHAALLALVDELYGRPVHELRMAAVELLVLEKARMAPDDLDLVERLIRASRTWALVDPLAISVAGDLVASQRKLARTLDRWAKDEDFWIRRSAILALLKPLRTGAGDWKRFTRYADAMLEEKEFFIRKAIGWVLREAGRKDADRVAEWITPRASRASGVTIREAVKPLSPRQQKAVLAAR